MHVVEVCPVVQVDVRMKVESDGYVSTPAISDSVVSFVCRQRFDVLNADLVTLYVHLRCVELAVSLTSYPLCHEAVDGIDQSEIAGTLIARFINPVHLGVVDSTIGITEERSTFSCSLSEIVEMI